MNIKRMSAKITSVRDVSPTAREVTLTLPEPLEFMAGAFINVFVEKEGKRERRAYSISSDPENQREVTLSIRRTNKPTSLSPVFWRDDVQSLPIDIMGPLGLNTADKITRPRVFLFAFGIGVSVVKGLVHHLLAQAGTEEVIIVTGSRTEEEILYKDFFESIAREDARVSTRFVLSRPMNESYPYAGYLHEHIADYDFTNATVYICGQSAACTALRDAIRAQAPVDPEFLIEAFD
jgi:NAD(P)H-flavin reductase